MIRWFEKKINENFLQRIIILFVAILIVLSVIAIIYGFIELIYYHEFSSKLSGFEEFIKVFLKYKEIFGGLFIVLASLFAIKQLVEIKRNNYRNMWFSILKEEMNDIRPDNEYIYRNVLIQSNNIYDYASERNFEIKNKKELIKFVNHFFLKAIPVFEIYDINYKKYSGYYPDNKHTYAEKRFLNALIRLMQPSKQYIEDFTKDYLEIYRKCLFENNDFNTPRINAKIYKRKTKELLRKGKIHLEQPPEATSGTGKLG